MLELMNVKGRDLRDADVVICDLDTEPCPSPLDEMVPGQIPVFQKEPEVKIAAVCPFNLSYLAHTERCGHHYRFSQNSNSKVCISFGSFKSLV